jgi:membrane protein required for colicin V production
VVVAPVDYVVLVILGIALLRGLLRGLLRETFSLVSLVAAVLAVKLYYGPVADWLLEQSEGRIGEASAPWAAGALLAIGAIGITTLTGRILRRGAKAAGLGWADRAGGALLGTAEGLLVAGVLIAVLGLLAGREHRLLAGSRSLEAYERFEQIAASGELPEDTLPDVAGGPREAR